MTKILPTDARQVQMTTGWAIHITQHATGQAFWFTHPESSVRHVFAEKRQAVRIAADMITLGEADVADVWPVRIWTEVLPEDEDGHTQMMNRSDFESLARVWAADLEIYLNKGEIDVIRERRIKGTDQDGKGDHHAAETAGSE